MRSQFGHSDTLSTIDSPAPSARSAAGTWLWMLMGLMVSCLLGAIAVLAFNRLTSLPMRTACHDISSLSPEIDRLYCAQEKAESGELADLMAGLTLTAQWTPGHPLHKEAQRWMEQWSESVLSIARQRMAQGDMPGAIDLASQIPTSSPIHEQVQATITEWQTQWQAGEAIFTQAQNAIQNQDWELAAQQVMQLNELPYDYWRQERARELSQQIVAEKQARGILAEAKAIAQGGMPTDLQTAIDQVNQIKRDTYTWTDAQPELNQWGEALLAEGLQQWQAGNLDDAIILARQVQPNPTLESAAEHLITLSQAGKLVRDSQTHWKSSPKQIWNLMEATAAARHIPSDSRFYAHAQESLASWSSQLKDVTQLQYAQVFADLGQRQFLATAIAQAQQVPADHPRRVQAQTLIAHWTLEMERLEDRPLLHFAQGLAEAGTIPALKEAIAAASQIPMGQVLRGEAQGLIYAWNREIEVLEDQPFLTMARIHAGKGNLTDAIQAAAVIRPGRALYYQAQAAIADWQDELWRRDQPRIAQRDRATTATADSETFRDELPNPFQTTEATGTPEQELPQNVANPFADFPLPPDLDKEDAHTVRRTPLRLETSSPVPLDRLPDSVETVPVPLPPVEATEDRAIPIDAPPAAESAPAMSSPAPEATEAITEEAPPPVPEVATDNEPSPAWIEELPSPLEEVPPPVEEPLWSAPVPDPLPPAESPPVTELLPPIEVFPAEESSQPPEAIPLSIEGYFFR